MSAIGKYSNIHETWLGGRTWAFKGYITGAATPVASILKILVPVGTEIKILAFKITMEDISTGLATTLQHIDHLGSEVLNLAHDDLDNIFIQGPRLMNINDTITDYTPGGTGFPYIPYIISGGEHLWLTTGALDTGKDLTLVLRARIRGIMPIVSASGTGVVLTTTYSKVI